MLVHPNPPQVLFAGNVKCTALISETNIIMIIEHAGLQLESSFNAVVVLQ